MKKFVIYSNEATLNNLENEPLYWSNINGWADISNATVFTENELSNFIPDDGKYVQLPE